MGGLFCPGCLAVKACHVHEDPLPLWAWCAGRGGGGLPCIYCGVAELGPVGWAGGLSVERIQGIVMLRHLWPFHSWWWPK